MQKHAITPQQQKTLDFIIFYQEKYNTRPTLVEVGNHIGVSAAAAQFKVDSLFRKKILKLNNNIYIISSSEL